MASLFSHAPEPESAVKAVNLPAREYAFTVPVTQTVAFEAFTDLIHLWWPMETLSSFGVKGFLAFDAGKLMEESDTGEAAFWGTVREWDPPRGFVLDLVLGGDPLAATRLILEFVELAEETGPTTHVTLRHDGWPGGSEGQRIFEKYSHWPTIIARYRRFMGATNAVN